jgi:hypothetical protein
LLRSTGAFFCLLVHRFVLLFLRCVLIDVVYCSLHVSVLARPCGVCGPSMNWPHRRCRWTGLRKSVLLFPDKTLTPVFCPGCGEGTASLLGAPGGTHPLLENLALLAHPDDSSMGSGSAYALLLTGRRHPGPLRVSMLSDFSAIMERSGVERKREPCASSWWKIISV